METIYNWLLHNTGNESNYLTILNVQRHIENGETVALEVMARTQDFEVVNLLINLTSLADQPVSLPERTLKENHFFADENQIIAYLLSGETTNAEPSPRIIGVYVFVPISDAGEISFPAQH